MLRLCICLISLCLFQNSFAGVVEGSQGRAQRCAELLMTHVQGSSEEFLPWTQLGRQLGVRDSATVLVRLPTAGVIAPLKSLLRLDLPPIAGLEIPYEFSALIEQSVYAVIKGPRSALLEAQADLGSRYTGLGFQILGSEVAQRAFELPLPQRSIEIKATADLKVVDHELRLAPEGRFIMFDGQTAQMSLVYPRADLKGLTDSLLASLNIERSDVPGQAGLVEWLRLNPVSLQGRRMLRWGPYWVISQEGYSTLKQLEGRELKLASATTVKVAQSLRRALDECTSEVCVVNVPPQVEEEPVVAPAPVPAMDIPEALPPSVLVSPEQVFLRERSNGYLKLMMETISQASNRSLMQSEALSIALIECAKKFFTQAEGEEFLKEITKLDLAIWDGRQLTKFLNTGMGAYLSALRFEQAWKILVGHLVPELKDAPITAENVDTAIAAIHARLREGPPDRVAKAQRLRGYNIPKPPPTVDKSHVILILDFLKDETGARLHIKDSVRPALEAVSKKVGASSETLGELAKLPFVASDGLNARAGGAAMLRLVNGWKFFASQVDSRFTDMDVSTASIHEVIDAYRLRVSGPVAVAPVPQSAPAPAPAPVPVTPLVKPLLGELAEKTTENFSREAKESILQFLKERIDIGKLKDPDGLQRGFFGALHPLYKRDANASIYRQTVKDIHFSKGEYALLVNGKVEAERRLQLGWRLLQKLLNDSNYELPITAASVEETKIKYFAALGVSTPSIRTVVMEKPVEGPKKHGAPRLSISKEARHELSTKFGLQPDEIDAMLKQWHGYILYKGLPGAGSQIDWTLLIRSGESRFSRRDDAFVAEVRKGEILRVTQNTEGESLFYRMLSEQLGYTSTLIDLDLKDENGVESVQGPLRIDRNVIVKLKLKHRLDVAQVEEILKDVVIIEQMFEDNCVNLQLRTISQDPVQRYRMCYSTTNTVYSLRSFYPIN